MSRLADEFMIPRHRFSIDFVWNIFNMMTSVFGAFLGFKSKFWNMFVQSNNGTTCNSITPPENSVLFTIYERKSVWLILKIRFHWIGA